MVQIVECPRDAMQGMKEFISTKKKVRYINSLLKVGFHTIDVGSFVSPKAIPQMADTAAVLDQIDLSETKSHLLAIVANLRGANDAVQHASIKYLGYPFSISETFQLRNTNATIAESLERVKQIQELCINNNKELVLYISMGFGNPYGDDWNVEIVKKWVSKLADLEIKIFSLSDTIGVSTPDSIAYLFSNLIPSHKELTFGAHLHTQPHNWKEKIESAYNNGCLRFDGAIKGYGGCPMAKDDLTGNMPTENMVNYFDELGVLIDFNHQAFSKSMYLTNDTFPISH